MNYWQIGFNIAQLILTLAVLWSSRNKVTNNRFTQLENGKLKLDLEVKHLKQKLAESRPPCENHKRMEDNDREISKRLDDLHGAIKKVEGVVEGRMEGIGGALDTIQQHLLSGGK